MSSRDWVLFIFTFVVAVLCGMYLYYTTFVPAYLTNPVVTDIAARFEPEWTIGVRVYGGCERRDRCPAFSLDSDGRYRYQPEPNTPVERGRVPQSLREAFTSQLEPARVRALATLVPAERCRSYTDGLDYRILVTTPSERYDLNTCGTALPYDGPIVAGVEETLRYLDNPDRYQGGSSGDAEQSVQGFLERQLDAFFDYDDVQEP